MEVSPEVGLIIEIDSDSCHLVSLAVRILDRLRIKVFGRKSSLGQANDRSTLVKKVALRVEIAVPGIWLQWQQPIVSAASSIQ